LYSVQVHWSSIFILAKHIISLLEHKMNRFLWTGSDAVKAKAKVGWNVVCVPKKEGGLGLKML